MPRNFTTLAYAIPSMALALVSGCVEGSRSVRLNSTGSLQTVIEYKAEGPTNLAMFQYSVVESQGTRHLLQEQIGKIKRTLIDLAWSDAGEEHYVTWEHAMGINCECWEYVIPVNRAKRGYGYLHHPGCYNIVTVRKSKRPIPIGPMPPPDILLLPQAGAH